MVSINTKDILRVYKREGNIKEYLNGINYLSILNSKNEEEKACLIRKRKIRPNTARRWIKGIRTPYSIKCLNYLKEKSMLPYKPTERTARIFGFLQGDGPLLKSFRGFSFISKDKEILLEISKDVFKEFKILGKIKQKRKVGDIECIHGKKFFVKFPTYEIKFNSRTVSSLLLVLGATPGNKMNKKINVPQWIRRGNKKIKREFLKGLFDAEFSNSQISQFTSHKANLSSPRMEMGKKLELEENLKEYLSEISSLLKDFHIESKVTYRREYKKGRIAWTLLVSNKLLNIKKLIDSIGFHYNTKRENEAIKINSLIKRKLSQLNSRVS